MMQHPWKLWVSRLLAVTFLTLPACSSTYREPPLAADHPANPSAQSSPLPERSTTLATEKQPSGGQSPVISPMPASQNADAYVCPMHPNVTSDKPDQTCPECGMKLVPKSQMDHGR